MTEKERAEWERQEKRRAIRNFILEALCSLIVSVIAAVLTTLYLRGYFS